MLHFSAGLLALRIIFKCAAGGGLTFLQRVLEAAGPALPKPCPR